MRKISILFENKLSVFTFQFAGAFIFPVCRDQPGENIPSVVSPLSDSGRTGSQRSIFFHEQDAAGHRNRSVEGLQNGISGYLGIKMSSGSDSVSADLDVLDKCRVLFRSDTVSAPHRFIFPAFCRSGTDDTESVSSGIPLSDEGAGLFQRCSDSAGDKTSTDHRKSRGCGIYPDAA